MIRTTVTKSNKNLGTLWKKVIFFTLIFVTVFSGTFKITSVAEANNLFFPAGTPGAAYNNAIADSIGGKQITEQACSALSPASWGQCLFVGFAYVLENAILPIFASILALVSMLLDFVVRFSLDTSNFSGMTAIKDGWVIIRDISNIFFIFILVYIAISTILQLSSHSIKSSLTKVIIVALLINFSLFFTKVIIDAGNIVAHGYYNAIVQNAAVNPLTKQPSISSKFMDILKIQKSYDPKSGVTRIGNNSDVNDKLKSISGTSQYIAAFYRIGLISVAIYVFFHVALIFIGRIIAFVFLMVLSPIGFLGMILPKTKGYADEYWKTLIDQTLVAPVFFVLLYIVMKIMGSPAMSQMANVGTSGEFPIGYYFNFAILIGLLWKTLDITKSLGGKMGQLALDYGKKAIMGAAGVGLALATGGTAAVGRGVIGAAVAGASSAPAGSSIGTRFKAGLKNIAPGVQKKIASGFNGVKTAPGKTFSDLAGKAVSSVGKTLSEGSYDLRRAKIPFVKTNLGEATKKYTGIDMGKAMSPAEREKERRKEEAEKKKEQAEIKLETDSNALLGQILAVEQAEAKNDQTALDDAHKEIKRILGQMSSKDIAGLDPDKFLSKSAIATNLGADVMQAISDNKELGADKKKSIVNQRILALGKASGFTMIDNGSGGWMVDTSVSKSSADSAKTESLIKNLTDSELTGLDTKMSVNSDIVMHMNAKQVKAMRDKGHLSAKDQNDFNAQITQGHKAYASEGKEQRENRRAQEIETAIKNAGTNDANVVAELKTLNDAEMRFIPRSALFTAGAVRTGVVDSLSGGQLGALDKAGILTSVEKAAIKARILSLPTMTSGKIYLTGPAGPLWS